MSPLAALVADWILTAFWPIIGQSGTKRYSPLLFMEAGLVIGGLALAPWLTHRRHWERVFSAELALPLCCMAFFSGLASFLYVSALNYTTPSNAAIMAQVEVLYSAFLCAWLLRERITLVQALASFLVVMGTGLIVAHDLASPRWKGDLLILATPWMFQVSHVFAKRLPKNVEPLLVSGARVFYGALIFLPFSIWAALHQPLWSWSRRDLGVLVLQGIGMSSVNLLLWYMAILRMDLAKATAFLLSYPALTMIFSWALGRESVTGVQVAGLLVTLSGACWLSRLALQTQEDAAIKTPVTAGVTAGDLIR